MKNQIIIAMDNSISDGIRLISKTKRMDEVYGYKIGSLWILEKSTWILKTINEVLFNTDKKIILDMQKWGTDIPSIIQKQVDLVALMGVDELIICPMGGGFESLKAFGDACNEHKIKPICVLEMTHELSDSYLKPNAHKIIFNDARGKVGITSFVIPSTKKPRPEILHSSYEYYTTGLKVQNGEIRPMVDAGVSKFIMGRYIYEAKNPSQIIKNVSNEINKNV